MTSRFPSRLPWVSPILVVGALVAVVAGFPAPAAAQLGSCGTDGIVASADVRVTSPGPGAVVSGPTVSVTGTASVPLVGQLTRVDVNLGGQRRSQSFEPSSSVNFDIDVDISDLPPGTTSLTVVACGPLARGTRQMTVTVAPARTTTTEVRTSTTVAAPGGTQPSTTTAAPNTTAAPSQTPTTLAGSSTTTVATTTSSAPTSTPVPTTTGSSRRGTAVVLGEEAADRSERSPLWVGLVVGLSGAVGLLLSAATWRRRSRASEPEPAEPTEPGEPGLEAAGAGAGAAAGALAGAATAAAAAATAAAAGPAEVAGTTEAAEAGLVEVP